MIILRLALTLLSTTTLSSGNVNPPTPWTPADLGAALALWFDASDSGTITLNGSTVSQWRDKSGNARHVSQSTASVQPAYLANDLNGKAGIDFYLAKGLNTSTSNPVVAFSVSVIKARNANWDGYHAMLDSYGSTAQRIGGMRANGDTGFWIDPYPSATWDDGIQRTPALGGYNSITSPRIVGFTVTSGRGNPMTGITIGNYATVTQGGSGTQYEIIALNTAPSTDDRQKLEGYLAWKWGLQANLPFTHPYRWDGTLFGYSRLWTPEDIATALWLDAADAATVTLNGSTVSQWRDKSGNARHVAQATAVKQPTYTLAAQNNLNVLSFDGSNDSLFANAATITINQPVHRFIVCKFLTKNFNSVVFDSDTQAAPFFFYNGENPGGKWVWPGGSYGTSDITNSHIHYHLSNNTASYYSIDGATPSGPVSAGANTLQGVRIGHLRGEFVNGYAFQGYVYEVLLVQGTLSDTDRQKIEGYIAWKWGTQSALPAGHPYKNGAPTV